MSKYSKKAFLSTEQLKQIEAEKETVKVILSSIKEGEKFVYFTLEKDIAELFFPETPLRFIKPESINRIFKYLKECGFMERIVSVSISTIPIYKCLKRWSNQTITPQ